MTAPLTAAPPSRETVSETPCWEESVRNWDLDDRAALVAVAFPFTSRHIPRASRIHRGE